MVPVIYYKYEAGMILALSSSSGGRLHRRVFLVIVIGVGERVGGKQGDFYGAGAATLSTTLVPCFSQEAPGGFFGREVLASCCFFAASKKKGRGLFGLCTHTTHEKQSVEFSRSSTALNLHPFTNHHTMRLSRPSQPSLLRAVFFFYVRRACVCRARDSPLVWWCWLCGGWRATTVDNRNYRVPRTLPLVDCCRVTSFE